MLQFFDIIFLCFQLLGFIYCSYGEPKNNSDMETGLREILFDIQSVESGILIANNTFTRFDAMKALHHIGRKRPGPALTFHRNWKLEYVEFRNLLTIRSLTTPRVRWVDDMFPVSARENLEASKQFTKIITAATLVPATICDTTAFEMIVTSTSHYNFFGQVIKTLMTFLGMFFFLYAADIVFFITFKIRKYRYSEERKAKKLAKEEQKKAKAKKIAEKQVDKTTTSPDSVK